jgi:hypothetical protein
MTPLRWSRFAPILASLSLAGCDDGRCVDPPQGSAGLAAISGGTPSHAHPEFGILHDGSGNLIAPSTVLTAAHVVRYQSTDDPALLAGLTFEIQTGTQCHPETIRFPVVAVHSFTPPELSDCVTPWSADVGLVRLGRPVPAEVAMPRALATALPAEGDAVTAVGYGWCPGDVETSRTQTIRSFTLSRDLDVLCGGDSGGALLVGGPDGPIAGVHSQSCSASAWRMVFGDVVDLRSQIEAKTAEWEARYGGE